MYTKQQLQENLRTGTYTIQFIKKSTKELRTMICTLNSEHIPPKPVTEAKEEKAPRKENDNLISVYDLEKKDWRSFNIDSIVENSFKQTSLY